MTAIFRTRVALVVAAIFVVCLMISHTTKDTKGLEGAVSWVTFTGMWVSVPVVAIIITGTAVLGLRRRTHRGHAV